MRSLLFARSHFFKRPSKYAFNITLTFFCSIKNKHRLTLLWDLRALKLEHEQ
jgi:hypothetical protein